VLSSRMTESLRKTLAESAPNTDAVFALTLKSKMDIMGELGIKMGLVTPARLKKLAEDEIAYNGEGGKLSDWLDQIPADSRRLIEHLATDLHQVLNRSLPNKPSARLVDLEGAEGKQVPEQIILNGKTYTAPKFLGEGGLGLIIKYTDAQSGESVVVKSLLNVEQHSEMVKELQAHRHVMGGSGHENIITMRGVVRGDNDSLYMVMDLAGGGDLARVSESLGEAVKQGILPWRAQLALAQHLIRDAVAGMQHMQSRNMMHLDVKALNFLLDDNGKVMLSDFGSGQRTGALTADRDYIPTTYYAPEWGGDINQKTDIYQLGRALRSVLGQDAFGTKPVSGQVGTDLAFINAMLDDDPAKRPTLTALASSSFVREAEAQDPDKMQTLLRAAVAYSKGAGKEIHALHDELASFQDRLHRAEVALEGTDSLHQPEQLRDRMNQVMRLNREVEGVQERLRLLHARPEIKALTEALNRAAQGLV
jgi:serine/threonine protein kinase